MRATFVSSGLDTGGAEFALLRLLPAMRAYGVESSVVSLRSAGTVGPLLESHSVATICLGMPTFSAILHAMPRLARHVREWRSSLIHGWMYHGNIAATVAGAQATLPVVWGVRQSLGLGTRDKWLTRRIIQAGALASRTADLIVYNSATAREQHERRGYARRCGAVIPNGFDTESLRPSHEQREAVRTELEIGQRALVIGHVARFHPAKDHRTFLGAAARLRRTEPAAMFVLVGEGVSASNPELMRLVAELGLADSVRLLGRRSDVDRVMTAFDVFCLTSSGMEGFPNVVGEAMSCGVPCVGTAVGDVAELIGDTGEIVPPSDPDAVASALSRLLAMDPEMRQGLGRRARQRVIDCFSIREIARLYADVLHSVAERRR